MKNFDGWKITDVIAYIGKHMANPRLAASDTVRSFPLPVEHHKNFDAPCDYCHTGCDICMGYPINTVD